MPEAEFTKLLKTGVPRNSVRGTRYEYSNLGYAMLGRIIQKASGKDFASYVGSNVFKPLGMNSTTYENADVPAIYRAIGYRFENGQWSEEPYMKHGAFGSMGGITTSANDYAKWIGYLLSAWPAEGNAKADKATIRAMTYGGGFAHGPRGAVPEPRAAIAASPRPMVRDWWLAMTAFSDRSPSMAAAFPVMAAICC